MTTETQTEPTAAPKRGGFTPEMRAKAAATRAANAARRAAKVPAVPAQKPSDFAGMTKNNCCDACSPNGCIISGINVCAHPNKGGLQAAQMRDPKALARIGRAKDYLDGA